MLTNPVLPILLRSTSLNLKWGKESEIGQEMSAAEDLFCYATKSFCVARWAPYDQRALLSFVNNCVKNVPEFSRNSLIIDKFMKFHKAFS